MRSMFNWLAVGLVVGCLLAAFYMVTGALSGAVESQQVKKEQCIYLKYQKDAEKFLDMDCQRYVRYKQDNN